MITLEQIKAARAMLDLSQKELAEKAGIAIATLNNIERGVQTDPKVSTIKAIQQTLEGAGIEFTNHPLGGIGLSLKPKALSPDIATILIVDDSKTDRLLYKTWLSNVSGKQYRIVEADGAKSGFDAFIEHQPQCVVLDFMLYGADGFQLLAALRKENVQLPPIVFVTGMHNDVLQQSAKSAGVYTYLNKQKLSKEQFCATIEKALKQNAL